MHGLVSIIIANYNYGHFLGEAIESALQQTYPHVEIIVIDDGSTDDSLDIATRHPVTVIHQKNQGVSAARNNGAAHAQGEYILFLDSDDRLYPDAIEKLTSAIKKSTANIAYIYGLLQFFGAREGLSAGAEFNPIELAKRNYMSVTTLLRKAAFDKVGGFDRGMQVGEDWELYIRLWHAGFSGNLLPAPILYYRKHKPPTRKKTRVPKRFATAQLIYLYPRFFIRTMLSNPLRYLYYRCRYDIANSVRHHGPSPIPPQRLR